MNNPDQEYDFSQTPFDLNEPPPSPPLEEIDMSGPSFHPDDQDYQDEMAAQNAIPVSNQNVIKEVPPHVLKEAELGLEAEAANMELTDFSLFLNQKYAELTEKAKAKNPNAPDIGHDSIFEKNIQSHWFVEYNQAKVQDGQKEKILLCKPNGFFYSDKDSIESALKDYGFNEEAVNELAPHLQFNFIGNTEIRGSKAKGTQRGHFKTFVMNLKDPTSDASKHAMAEIVAQKTLHVQKHLDKNYDLDKAKDTMLNRVGDLIAAETKKTGVEPFVGVGPALFLNSSAIYEKLSEIPEIKDKFKVEPLDVNGNKITYTGFSEGLNSYFNSELRLHKITSKNTNLMPQKELESYIIEHLKDEKEPLLISPEHSDNRIIEKQQLKHDEKLKAENGSVAPDGEQKPDGKQKNKNQTNEQEGGEPEYKDKNKVKAKDKDDPSDEKDDEKQKRKRSRDNEEEEGKKSLAEVAIKAAQKITEAALKALIRLAQLVILMLIALIQAIFSMGKFAVSKMTNKPYVSGPNMLTKFAQTNFSDNLFESKNNGKSPKNEQANDVKNALEDIGENDKKLNGPEANNGPEATKDKLSEQLATLGLAPTFDPLKDASSKVDGLGDEKKAELDSKVAERLALMSDDEKSEYLKTLTIPAAHKFGDELETKVAPTLMYHDQHGVLLGKGDEVELEDGSKGGVLSAYDVGGKLHYAIASEGEDKNYKLDYLDAESLKLVGHNKIGFDNETNLIKQADDAVLEKYQELHDGKIDKIEILDYSNPQESAISVNDLVAKIPLLSHDTVDSLKPVNHAEDYEQSTVKRVIEDNYATFQLHNDKTDSLTTNIEHGQRHPFFGKILDINDSIEATLPNSGMLVDGTVTGAYVNDNKLYYNLKTDKNTYSLPATDITLTKVNGGNLTAEEIKQITSEPKKHTIIADEHKVGGSVVSLYHADALPELDLNNSQRKGLSNRVVPGYFPINDVGVKPLNRDDNNELIGSGKVYSVTDDASPARYFVSLGQVIDPETNQVRAVGLEVKKSHLAVGGFATIQKGKAAIQEIDLDNPRVSIAAEKSPQHLESTINKATEMYETGASKAKASLMSTFIIDAEKSIDHNGNVEKYYVEKQIAASLLADNSNRAFSQDPTNVLGAEANLSNTAINDKAVTDTLNNPESQKGNLDSVNTPPHKPSQLLPNEISFNASATPNMGFDDLNALVNRQNADVKLNLQFSTMEQAFTPIESKVLVDYAVQNQLSANEALVASPVELPVEGRQTEIVNNVKKLSSSLPESVLMRVALSYVTGERLCTNQEGGIDLLTGRENLLNEHGKIKHEVKELIPSISPFLKGFDSEGKISNIGDVKVNDFNGLKALLTENQEASLRLDNITNKEINFASKLEDHLDKIETRFEKINNKIDLNQFDMNNLKTLNSVAQEFIDTVKSDYENTSSTNNLINLLNEVKKSDNDLDYGDIAKKLVNQNAETSAKLDDRLNTLTSSFQPKLKDQSASYDVENTHQKKPNDLSL